MRLQASFNLEVTMSDDGKCVCVRACVRACVCVCTKMGHFIPLITHTQFTPVASPDVAECCIYHSTY